MTDEELKNLFSKADAEIASLAAENKETGRLIKELREQSAETGRIVAEVSKQIGGINDNIGYHAEQFFQNVLADKKIFGGIEYNDIVLNMKHGEEVEFDIFLKNGNSVALIEVKNRIHPDFVKNLAEERINKFREYFPEYKGYDVYLGIAGFSFSKAVLEEAKKYGIGIIRQAGDSIEVDATGLMAYRSHSLKTSEP